MLIDRPGRDETLWFANLHTGGAHAVVRFRLGTQKEKQKPPPASSPWRRTQSCKYVAWSSLVPVLTIDRAASQDATSPGACALCTTVSSLFVRGRSISLPYHTSLCGERGQAAQQGCLCVCARACVRARKGG